MNVKCVSKHVSNKQYRLSAMLHARQPNEELLLIVNDIATLDTL